MHIFGEAVLTDANTELMARKVSEIFDGKHVAVYPDPAGRQRRTSAALGQTDLSILESYGFEVIAPRRAPLVVDRINEVNAMLENSKDSGWRHRGPWGCMRGCRSPCDTADACGTLAGPKAYP